MPDAAAFGATRVQPKRGAARRLSTGPRFRRTNALLGVHPAHEPPVPRGTGFVLAGLELLSPCGVPRRPRAPPLHCHRTGSARSRVVNTGVPFEAVPLQVCVQEAGAVSIHHGAESHQRPAGGDLLHQLPPVLRQAWASALRWPILLARWHRDGSPEAPGVILEPSKTPG